MATTGITQERLLALLANLPTYEPAGVRIMREMGPPKQGGLFPVGELDREAFVAATIQAANEHATIKGIVKSLRNVNLATTHVSLADYS